MLENLTQWIPEEVLRYLERTSAASVIMKGKNGKQCHQLNAPLFSKDGGVGD